MLRRHANQAVRVMLNEIARLQREPIGPDDISAVIAQFLTPTTSARKPMPPKRPSWRNMN